MPAPPKAKIFRLLLLIAKVLVAALVAWGIWTVVRKARAEMSLHDLSLGQLKPLWLLASAGFYFLGLLPMGLFWHRVLWALGQKPTIATTLRAYYIGHLGKYVPGKAMVVVLRAGLVKGHGVDGTIAAVSVFIETLTMLATGAFIAAIMLALHFRDRWQLLILALAMMLAAGVPTIPPLFRWLVRRMMLLKLHRDLERWLAGLTMRVMVLGWLANLLAWLLLGASLWAVLKALPMDLSIPGLWAALPLTVAATGLAMVAGVLSPLPGGVGIREWVISSLIVPHYGAMAAIISAIVLRLVWLSVELAAASMLYLFAWPSRSAESVHNADQSTATPDIEPATTAENREAIMTPAKPPR